MIPSLVQPHRHRAYKRLHPGGALIVGCPEPTADILVIEDLDFEGEVLLQLPEELAGLRGRKTYIFDDHDQEGQLDAESLVSVCRAGDIVRRNVRSHDLEHRRLDIRVSDSLDVPIAHALVPDLKRLRTKIDV